jgi:vacuolar-type H+-ATPase subunit H
VAMAQPPAPTPPGSIEELKRIKQTEHEWDEKLAQAKANADAERQRWRDETDALLQQVRTDSDRQRENALSAARQTSEAEAQKIVNEGEAAAESIEEKPIKLEGDRATQVIAAILDEFVSK